MLREQLYRDGMREFGPGLSAHCGFVAVAPLVIRLEDETGGDVEAVASDANLIESGLSQEPLLVQYKMGAHPFDRSTALWVLGRCAWEDATRWLAEFPWLQPGPDLWWAVGADYSLGTGATRRVLRHAATCNVEPGRLMDWVEEWAPEAEAEPYRNWWGRAKPAKVVLRLKRQVRRIRDAGEIGSLEPRDMGAPDESLPAGYAPMPDALVKVCRRLIALRKLGSLTHEEQARAHATVKAYAKTLDRQRRRRPLLVAVAAKLLPRVPRHPEAAVVRRAA
jgi:hypothetical protein